MPAETVGGAGGVIFVTTGRLNTLAGGGAVCCDGPITLSRVGRSGTVFTTFAPFNACVVTGTNPSRVGRDPVNTPFETAVTPSGR